MHHRLPLYGHRLAPVGIVVVVRNHPLGRRLALEIVQVVIGTIDRAGTGSRVGDCPETPRTVVDEGCRGGVATPHTVVARGIPVADELHVVRSVVAVLRDGAATVDPLLEVPAGVVVERLLSTQR